MTYTWRDLHSSGLALKGPLPLLKPQRKFDCFLMDVFVSQAYSPEELYTLNAVRQYKQASCLSDICTANGKQIDPQYYTKFPPNRPSQYEWPRCCRPTAAHLTTWKQCLAECFLPPEHDGRTLAVPLGPWLNPHDTYWDWWYSPEEDCLYHRHTNNSWASWPPSTFLRYGPDNSSIPSLPDDAIRATVYGTSNSPRVSLTNSGTHTQLPGEAPPTSIAQMIAQLPDDAKWAIELTDLNVDSTQIAAAVLNGSCTGVSDGSLKDGAGTAAFILGP